MSEIDYKAIAAQLQCDLEQARLEIVRMRFARSPLDKLSTDRVKRFLVDNYILISAGALIIFVFVSLFDTVKGLFTKHSKE